MNSYQALSERHQQEINAFPMKWGFGDEQIAQGMRELGLDPTDTEQVIGIGAGGFIRKSDKQAFINMLKRHRAERESAKAVDVDGTGYIYEMFDYELANHEYVYTQRLDETLGALGMTIEEIYADARLTRGLKDAIRNQKDALDGE
ncbi:hypothetical protein LJC33_06570 [Eubacteriales bacterium OttesenSCG-928-N13]|nr:hypothetical protein [Eubacteriales bacterium OttesenSCG-928-N13]